MNNKPTLPIWYMVVRYEYINGFGLIRVLACQATTYDQLDTMERKYQALKDYNTNTQSMIFFRVEDGLFTDFLKFFIEVLGDRKA